MAINQARKIKRVGPVWLQGGPCLVARWALFGCKVGPVWLHPEIMGKLNILKITGTV